MDLSNIELAELIIREAHGPVNCITSHTMGNVPQVLDAKLRQQTKKVILQCVRCQRFDNLSNKYGNSHEMPEKRVIKALPLNSISLDFCGLLSI